MENYFKPLKLSSIALVLLLASLLACINSSPTSDSSDTNAPAKPFGLEAKPGDSKVILTWYKNLESDLTGYNIYRSPSSGSSYLRINASPILKSPNPSFTDTINVKNGTPYYYVVTALDGSGNESVFSDEAGATPAGKKCTLSLMVDPSGGGSISPSVGTYTYEAGTKVSITAEPASGYRFVKWSGDVAGNTSASTTIAMTDNKTVTAHFEKIPSQKYVLTMWVGQSEGGATTPSVGTHTYESGTKVNITAFPASGYRFVSWTGDMASNTSGSTTVTMTGNKTVTANFEKIPPRQYTLTMTVNETGEGTTTPSVGTYTYDEGTQVSITASPASGYRFVNWTGDVAGISSAATTVTMTGNRTVTANFEKIPPQRYVLSIGVNQFGWGTTTPVAGSHTYDEGSQVSISAVPASGYRFVNWTGDVAGISSASTTVTMTGNKTVYAYFEKIPEKYSLTVQAGQSGGGVTTPSAGIHTYESGTVVSLSAVPSSGYRFVGWTGDVANSGSASTTITMTGNKTVVANFEKIELQQFVLSIGVNQYGTGTITPSIGNHTYDEGAQVSITAVPASGYRFVSWAGDVASISSISTTVVMTGNKTVYAFFEKIPEGLVSLTIGINQGGSGTTTPSTGTYSYETGTVVTISAAPVTGYRFVGWSGDVASSGSSSTTITMTGNKTVIANFEKTSPEQYTLTMGVNMTGWGQTSPSIGTHAYNPGTKVSITAVPSAGYRFVSWTGDVASPGSYSTTVSMTGSKTVSANFEKFPKEDTKYSLTISASPSELGSTAPSPGTYTYDAGTVVSLSASPVEGYSFVSWTGDVASPTSSSTTVTMNGNKTVTANFEKGATRLKYTLTMAVSPSNLGATSPSAGSYTYDAGTVVTVSAFPVQGYRFAGWSGGTSSSDSAYTTIAMTGDKTVTANFVKLETQKYTLTMAVNSPNLGSTSPSVGSYTYDSGTVVQISATPVTGCRFSNWSGEATSPTSASTTVIMNAGKTVTANFVPINIGLDQR